MNVTLTGWALLIDAEKKRLKATGQELLACGMRVSYAPSAGTALSFLKDHQPDIILFHAGLEEPFTLLEAIRADHRLAGLPLLLLTTGNEDAGLLESLFDSGVSDLVQLPPPIPFVLCNRVRMLLDAGRKPPVVSAAPVPPSTGIAAGAATGMATAVDSAPAAGPAFPQIEGISFDEAVRNCGGEDVLKTVMQKFYDSIEERAGALEGFVSAGDWKNYRIAVHSLKSSARLIGAMRLSEDAKALEADAGEMRTEEILSKTPALLDLYRSYRQRLLPVVEHEDEEEGTADDRPLLPEEDLASACRDLKECIGISDFDSADFIMGSLAGYRISEGRKELVARLKKAVDDVDRKEALALLSGI